MAGYTQQVVASAARTELAMLHTAPVLLESLALLQSLVQARNSFKTACSAGIATTACYSLNRASSTNASRNLTLMQQHNNNKPTSARSSMFCNYAQHRMASSSTTANTANARYTTYVSDGGNSSEVAATSSSKSPDDQHERQGAYRRGFGAKVALPSADVLHEVLMGQEATIKMRAYHIGARIHIGQVAQRAKQEGCRINSGKDYCIIWLNPSRHKFQGSSSSGSEPSSSSSSSSSTANSAPSGARYITLQQLREQLLSRGLYERILPPIMSKKQKTTEQHALQERLRRSLPPRTTSAVSRYRFLLGAVNEIPRSTSNIEPLLVAYRYGSVVFVGTRPEDEPGLVDEYVPSSMRYKAGGDSTWAQPNPMLQSRSPAEEHTVQVLPGQTEHAKKGTDQLLLRVLDIGGVRVLTSVLAQSAALKFYETSVAEALDKLAQYRARVRAAQADSTGWYGSAAASVASMSGEQERTFFKVIAASALVMNEARELLEMAEPAWQYAAYHSIWALTADDFELERRFKGLELKLRQVEKEAKHDVKDKAGRRYHRLEQSVVWLLVVSCLLAALEVSKKAIANSSSSSNSSSKRDGGVQHEEAASEGGISSLAEDTDTAAAAAAAATVENVSSREWNGDLQDTQSAAELQYANAAAETAGMSCDHDATAAAAAAADVGVARYEPEMVIAGGAATCDAGNRASGNSCSSSSSSSSSSRWPLWWRWRRNEDAR